MVFLQRAAGTFFCVRSMIYLLSSHHSCICMAFARLGGEFCQAQHLLLIVDKWTGEKHQNCHWYWEVFIDYQTHMKKSHLTVVCPFWECLFTLLLSLLFILLLCSEEWNLNGIGNKIAKRTDFLFLSLHFLINTFILNIKARFLQLPRHFFSLPAFLQLCTFYISDSSALFPEQKYSVIWLTQHF